jgi:Mn-dependent DtxR family transcriptional regulator
VNINSVSSGMVEVIFVINDLTEKNTWPPSRTEVSAVIKKSIACVSGYVNRLKVRDLVESRGCGLRLTEKGRKLLDLVKEIDEKKSENQTK